MTDQPKDPSEPTDTPAGQPASADQPAAPSLSPAPYAAADSPTVVGMPTPPPPPIAPPDPTPANSGVGFAAIGSPPGPPTGPPQGYGAPPPQGYGAPPPVGYQGGPPPGYPGGPPQGYGRAPGYYPPPPASGGGPSAIVILLIAVLLLAVVGVGGAYALKLGPFAPAPTGTPVAGPTPTTTHRPASGTPQPTAAVTLPPKSTPTPVPSATLEPVETPILEPTETPFFSIPPNPSPGAAGEELLTHVPGAIRESCTATDGVAPILAIATCVQDSGEIPILYYKYASNDEMNAAYEGFRLASQIEPDSGDCNDETTWPAEHGYTIGGVHAGRWLCTDTPGTPTIYWTDERLQILSQASQTLGDHTRIVDFWIHESGPNL